MSGSTWVKNKIELYEGEVIIFKRANSPMWYYRIYIRNEKKHIQKSCKTKNQYAAMEFAIAEYKSIQVKVAKEEKIFSITLKDAIDKYAKQEFERERRGLIKTDWLSKKNAYLRNHFMAFMTPDIQVNEITDKQFAMYIDLRLRICKRKESVRQEIVIIKHFYKNLLLKEGYVFRIPEIPEFRIREKDRAKRDDTFTVNEYDKLVRHMREWVKDKNVPYVRKPTGSYDRNDGATKKMKEWERQMEKHRRTIIRELILIAANSGLRAPKEILSLTWGDIKIRKEEMSLYGGKPKEVRIASIQINDQQKTGERINISLSGDYFLRLHNYYFEEFDLKPKDDQPVFLEMYGRRKGERLCKFALYRIWCELMNECGLDRIKFTLYHLRHFAITQQILNGVDVMLIAKNMGNSPNTIARHYEHVNMEKNAKALLQRRNTREEQGNEIDFR